MHRRLAGWFRSLRRRCLRGLRRRLRLRLGRYAFGFRRDRRDRWRGSSGRCIEIDWLGCRHTCRQGGGHRRHSGSLLSRDDLRGRRRRRNDSVEHGGEGLLELARIGRGNEGSAGRSGDTTQGLELIGLVVEADHVDAEALRLLLQRDGRRADVGVAGIAAIGDEDDIEPALRLSGLGGVAQSGGNGGLAFRLDLVEELALRCESKLARLRQDLAVGAVRRLAMAEGNEPER